MKSDATTEQMRLLFAFVLSLFGLGLAAGLVIALLHYQWKVATDIVAVVGLFTSVLGTLVGAFFGLQAGLAGREGERQAAREANDKLQHALAAMPPEKAEAVLRNR